MKTLVMAVGPVTRARLMPEIHRAWRTIDAELSLIRVARRVALAAEITFEAVLRMESIETASVARCLNVMVTRDSLAHVLSEPEVLIGDKDIWWPSA
jgi:hypothetical protein